MIILPIDDYFALNIYMFNAIKLLYCIVLYCIVLYCIVLCIVYCVLYCIVLYWNENKTDINLLITQFVLRFYFFLYLPGSSQTDVPAI